MESFSSINDHHKALEFDKVLLRLSMFANSKLAKKSCLNLKINTNKAQIDYELDLVDEAKRILIDDIAASIGEIYNIDKYFKNNFLTAQELIELCDNLKCARIVKNFISKTKEAEKLNDIITNIYVNKTLEDEIYGVFDSELNIKDTASELLKSLRNSYKDNKTNLKEALNKLLSDKDFSENLQDDIISTRDNRPVFQVKASAKNKIQGIIHDISSTNLTYFIEPASIVPLTNKIRQIEIEIRAEIDRILRSLSAKLRNIKDELFKNQQILEKIDVVFAKAKYSIYLKAQRALVSEEKILDIEKMRHPLLVDIKKEDEIIANDFTLNKNYHCLLITGSNTGGKTVCLKTAALMVLMTQAGLHIPVISAKIFPYENIYCDISIEQSLEQGFSTFSAHIKNIKNILDNINSNSLVLLDELGSGTNPSEGSALAFAILNYIKEKKASAIVTTHLGELKTLKYKDKYFENATVSFDVKNLKPTYNLIIGISGTSCAIDISAQLGLNEKIIHDAREILQKSSSPSSKIFSEIEKTSQSLIKKEQIAAQNLENSKIIKEEFEEKLDELKKTKRKSLENFKKKFQTQLEDARNEIKSIVDEMRKEKSEKIAARSYSRLNKLEEKIREEFSNSDDKLSEKFIELDINNLKIGQNVLIKKLNQIVVLESLPDKKGIVEIRIGNIKSKINISKLAKTDKKIPPYLKKIQVSFDKEDNLLSRLDLRGMRVLDGIEYLDDKLDKAVLKGLNQVVVIHGHGNGALKRAIRDYLKNSPYVAKFRYNDEQTGGDGVTIVDLV